MNGKRKLDRRQFELCAGNVERKAGRDLAAYQHLAESFKGGGVWNVIVNINDGLKAVGYALLVLFFVMGVVKTCGSFTEMKKPEVAFKCFIRFVLAQAAVSWGMELIPARFVLPRAW